MHIILLILTIIIFTIGMYFKKQNDEYESSTDTKAIYSLSHKYFTMRYEHPNVYFFKIGRLKKKLLKNKVLKPYERKVLIDFLLYSIEDDENNANFKRSFIRNIDNDRDLLFFFSGEKEIENIDNKEDNDMVSDFSKYNPYESSYLNDFCENITKRESNINRKRRNLGRCY